MWSPFLKFCLFYPPGCPRGNLPTQLCGEQVKQKSLREVLSFWQEDQEKEPQGAWECGGKCCFSFIFLSFFFPPIPGPSHSDSGKQNPGKEDALILLEATQSLIQSLNSCCNQLQE